jgi:hypothetical protein
MKRALLATILATAVLGARAPAAAPSDPVRLDRLRATVADYERQVAVLEATQAVENLQDAWGYYVDKGLWDRAASLFAADGTYEYGQQGVYVGRRRIEQAMRLIGPQGLAKGQLNLMPQLQPYIDVAPDGLSAKARWRTNQMILTLDGKGRWGAGVFENDYVKQGSQWKIARLHFYVTFLADYDTGWDHDQLPMTGASTTLPPDRPPTEIYQSLPGAYAPPYHYANPVTGRSGKWPQ